MLFFCLAFSMDSFSESIACHRCLTRSSWTDSLASFWTWNLSITKTAFGKGFLAIKIMLPVISKVISFTFLRSLNCFFSKTEITSSAFVPVTVSTIAPFSPFAALFVTIVYNSSWVRAVSSIDKYQPLFWILGV